MGTGVFPIPSQQNALTGQGPGEIRQLIPARLDSAPELNPPREQQTLRLNQILLTEQIQQRQFLQPTRLPDHWQAFIQPITPALRLELFPQPYLDSAPCHRHLPSHPRNRCKVLVADPNNNDQRVY
mgnify:CR=1 FL=1